VAAEALGIPRQTLSAQVGRGLERLGRRLGRAPHGVARSLAVLPIAAPRGGWDAATDLWSRAAVSSLGSGTATTATILGGVTLMSSKTALLLTLTAVLGVGFLGGNLVQRYIEGESAASGRDAVPARTHVSSPGSGSPTLAPTAPRAPDDVGELRREVRDLRARLGRAQARGDALEKRLAELTEPRAGPTFTFGRMGDLAAVRECDWRAHARAAKVIAEGVHDILKYKERGEDVPTAVYLRVQESADKMRRYEFRAYGKMPTSAKYNGENTHPISMANLLAAMLEEAGTPLSPEQITRVNKLGLAFEDDFARMLERHTDAMPRVERMLEEYRLKGRFIDEVVALLTADQREAVFPPGTYHVTGLDINSPTQMIAYTSPVLVGKTIEEIRGDLRALLAKNLKLEEAEIGALEGPIDAWVHDVREILTPVSRSRVKYYTFEDGAVAGEATVRLTHRLLKDLHLTDEAREALIQNGGFYMPRIVRL
jgi:hypothetical protein